MCEAKPVREVKQAPNTKSAREARPAREGNPLQKLKIEYRSKPEQEANPWPCVEALECVGNK